MGFKRAGFENPIAVVANGEEALEYLKGEGVYADRARFPVPILLLLDLKMPRKNGFDVLNWLRLRPEWKCLPVVVLTTSYYGKDINDAYDLGANSFLTKPLDFNDWIIALKELGDFWLQENKLPRPGPFLPAPVAEAGSDSGAALLEGARPPVRPREQTDSPEPRPAAAREQAVGDGKPEG